jgi:thiamine-monophosphate kinase
MNELEWVNFLKKTAGKSKDVLVGVGDDCALVKEKNARFLLKSDLSIEGVHFTRQMPYKIIAMRAVSRVLSDFAACGGVPKFIGVSAGIPKYVKDKQLKEIVSGILVLSRKYKFSLVGGDTSRSDKLFLDVWGVGVAKKPILRSTAKTGDYIFITNQLGARLFNQQFTPRINEARYLVNNFKINAMIDITDGFILDLSRILRASNKGAVVYNDLLPLTQGESDLYRGEDYELIFIVDKTEKNIETLKRKFYLVGQVKHREFGYKSLVKNKLKKIVVKGYQHF